MKLFICLPGGQKFGRCEQFMIQPKHHYFCPVWCFSMWSSFVDSRLSSWHGSCVVGSHINLAISLSRINDYYSCLYQYLVRLSGSSCLLSSCLPSLPISFVVIIFILIVRRKVLTKSLLWQRKLCGTHNNKGFRTFYVLRRSIKHLTKNKLILAMNKSGYTVGH